MPTATDPAARARSLWTQYDELKRLTTELGCTIIGPRHNPRAIDDLCSELIDRMTSFRDTYRRALLPGKDPGWP